MDTMAILDVGRVCRRTSGRQAGQFCVITEKGDSGLTVVSADGRTQKISDKHVEPTPHVVSAKDAVKGLQDLNLA